MNPTIVQREFTIRNRQGLHARPAAMLVNYEEYRRQRDTLDILGDPRMMKQIRQSRRFYAKHTKGLSFEEVFGEPRVPAKKRAR